MRTLCGRCFVFLDTMFVCRAGRAPDWAVSRYGGGHLILISCLVFVCACTCDIVWYLLGGIFMGRRKTGQPWWLESPLGGKACSPLATACYVGTLTQKLINVNLFTTFNLRKPFCFLLRGAVVVLSLTIPFLGLSFTGIQIGSLANENWVSGHSAHAFTHHFRFLRAIGCWIPWGAVVNLITRSFLSSLLLCPASVSFYSWFFS